ncbi:hypothetical protein [Pukyongiella litopenaei]|uniref:Uncharacterized protein n=1 Tax=Pukyongiella litopenaei TaxID=2605946 RepID=A0A2S0MLE0_9RHOB|nr:hypothetical protein [Pukyongiella litopenaei]AVO36581.1 hypothetical protein C6Y53_01945 [Pukyongiella litopenaei]
MMFVRLGEWISYALLVLGILRLGLGIFLATTAADSSAAARSYLATQNPGEAIDKGALMIFIAVVLGVLVEIAKAVRAQSALNK